MSTISITTNTPTPTTVTSPTPIPSTQTNQGTASPTVEDTVTISTQARAMYTTHHENGSIRYPSASTTSRLQALNDEVERMQLTYINAEVRGDLDEMGQAALAASRLRQQGATLDSEGTDATRVLRNYYANNALVKEAIQSPSTMKLNQVIWMAKLDWVNANNRGDASAMKAATALSENMRKIGGTVTDTMTFANLQALNDEVERMQLTYINAEARGDRDEMGQAALSASRLRQQGATLDSEGTAATRALRNYYTAHPEVIEAVQSRSPMALNKVIWQAKNDWAYANKTNDPSGMRAAAALSDNMRKMGGTVTEAMSLQNLRAMNDEVERMQLQYINAKVRGDQNEMAQSMVSAARFREMGATLGDEGTAATRTLQRYYDSNPLVAEAIHSRSTVALNKAIWQAKNDFAYAQTVNDTATMKATATLADNLRKLGGTITETMSLQQARDMAFPDIDRLNENVELAQMRYINAQVRGDQTGMHTALHEIQRMRELGATRGDEETSAIRALKRYYESDEFITGAIANRSTPALNIAIWKAKNDWLFANDHNDSATRKAAELVSENMRLMGGTIDASVSIEDAYRIAFQGIESPSPTTDTPQTDEGVLEQLWGYVESFLGIPEIKAGWEKLISPESSPWEKLEGVGTLAFNLAMNFGVGPRMIYRLGKAGVTDGSKFLSRTVAKEADTVTLGMTRAQMTEHMKQQAVEIRAQLPESIKEDGNIGIASIEIKGLPSELKSHSSVHYAEDVGAEGFVLLRENRVFETKFVNRGGIVNGRKSYDRKWDTESKLLEEIASRLGDNTAASGTIDLFTEKLACASCSDIILAFRRKYPNIRLNVYTNKTE